MQAALLEVIMMVLQLLISQLGRLSLSTTVRPLYYDLTVIDLKHGNSLSTYRGKVAYN